jgi:hypothetical protein
MHSGLQEPCSHPPVSQGMRLAALQQARIVAWLVLFSPCVFPCSCWHQSCRILPAAKLAEAGGSPVEGLLSPPRSGS